MYDNTNQAINQPTNGKTPTDTAEPKETALARYAIGLLLDGKSPNGTTPAQLGPYSEVYSEMIRAHGDGGKDAARRVYVSYAERSAPIAALRAADPKQTKKKWTAAELLNTDFPDPKWAVPDLMPVGLGVLAGRPKLGKSWLAEQVAIAKGTGGKVLGRQVEQGRVLYLALEDNQRRMKDRLKKQGATASTAIDYHFEWEPLTKRGMADLIAAVDKEGYDLVIIDTISRALGHSDQMDQAAMNVAYGDLQRLALDREICILLIDHHRKSAGGSGDAIDDVMAATAKTSVSDFVMGLYRQRGQKVATLKVSGRDIDEQELALQWDGQLFCWQQVGTSADIRVDTLQAGIVTAIRELGGSATVAKMAGWLKREPSNVYVEVQEMVAKGRLLRGEKSGREVPYSVIGDQKHNNHNNES